MGYKRRRHDDHAGRRESPVAARTGRIRKGFTQVGEPSHLARALVAQGLLQDLSEAHPDQHALILQTLAAVIREQPHKISFLAEVCCRAAAPIPFLALEMAHTEAQRALASDLGSFKVFFRFLCAMAPVIENPEVLTSCLLELLDRAGSDTVPAGVRLELYRDALLAAVYLPRDLVTAELRARFADVCLPELETALYSMFLDDAPFERTPLAQQLKQAFADAERLDWDLHVLAEPLIPVDAEFEMKVDTDVTAAAASVANPEAAVSHASDDVKAESPVPPAVSASADAGQPAADADAVPGEESIANPQGLRDVDTETNEKPELVRHVLRSIHVPDTFTSEGITPAPPRLFQTVDGVRTTPPCGSIASVLLSDVLTDNIRRMDFNRREVTRQLMVVDMFFARELFAPPGALPTALESRYKIEDVALEAVFTQLFDLSRAARLPRVYYHALLIEACVLAPQDVAPVLGRALRFIFNHLEHIDAEALFVAIDWFAHHVSNFAFTWKWNEWIDTLSLPTNHPQQVFVRELLGKQVRLSYPQRIRDVVPQEFKHLVPEIPDVPDLAFLGEESQPDAERLLRALRENSGAEEIATSLNPNVLIACLCQLGSRSVTHAVSYITRFEKLILKHAVDDAQTVGTVLEFWRLSPWVAGLVIKQYCAIGAVKWQTLVDFVVKQSELLLTAFGWEVLHDHPAEALSALPLIDVPGEYGAWWTDRIKKGIERRHALFLADEEYSRQQREQKQLEEQSRKLEKERELKRKAHDREVQDAKRKNESEAPAPPVIAPADAGEAAATEVDARAEHSETETLARPEENAPAASLGRVPEDVPLDVAN